ncbi:STR6 [Symbiodinium natans]|uniref:STR6 protein n=1 Tax=Symbiodinium natans TaxID=878477 RepID=A0A812TIF5_9DINO|nr:STR6 [Symbiodinium natans]
MFPLSAVAQVGQLEAQDAQGHHPELRAAIPDPGDGDHGGTMPRTQEALHLPSIFPARTGAKWAKTAHDKAPLEEGVDPTGENASLIWCRPSVLVGRNRIRRFAEASAGKLLGFLDQVDLTDLFPYPPEEVNLTNVTNDSNYTSWDYEFSWQDYGAVFQRQLAAVQIREPS